MTFAAITSLRRLGSAVFFLIAGLFIAIGLAVWGYSGMTVVDSILTTIWCASWCIAAIHNLYYRSVVAHRTVNQAPPIPLAVNDTILGLRRSTHSRIKGALITSTAVSALVMDLNRLPQLTPSHVERVLGSILWVGVGSLEVWLAGKHERRQENHPETAVTLFGFRPSVYYSAHAITYLTAGVLYAAALWTDENRSPLSNPILSWILAIPNSMWLLAGINEVTRTLQVLIEEYQSTSSTIAIEEVPEEIEEQKSQPVQAPVPPPEPQPEVITISFTASPTT